MRLCRQDSTETDTTQILPTRVLYYCHSDPSVRKEKNLLHRLFRLPHRPSLWEGLLAIVHVGCHRHHPQSENSVFAAVPSNAYNATYGTNCHSRTSGNPEVINEGGISWVPAFAGTTGTTQSTREPYFPNQRQVDALCHLLRACRNAQNVKK